MAIVVTNVIVFGTEQHYRSNNIHSIIHTCWRCSFSISYDDNEKSIREHCPSFDFPIIRAINVNDLSARIIELTQNCADTWNADTMHILYARQIIVLQVKSSFAWNIFGNDGTFIAVVRYH